MIKEQGIYLLRILPGGIMLGFFIDTLWILFVAIFVYSLYIVLVDDFIVPAIRESAKASKYKCKCKDCKCD